MNGPTGALGNIKGDKKPVGHALIIGVEFGGDLHIQIPARLVKRTQ